MSQSVQQLEIYNNLSLKYQTGSYFANKDDSNNNNTNDSRLWIGQIPENVTVSQVLGAFKCQGLMVNQFIKLSRSENHQYTIIKLDSVEEKEYWINKGLTFAGKELKVSSVKPRKNASSNRNRFGVLNAGVLFSNISLPMTPPNRNPGLHSINNHNTHSNIKQYHKTKGYNNNNNTTTNQNINGNNKNHKKKKNQHSKKLSKKNNNNIINNNNKSQKNNDNNSRYSNNNNNYSRKRPCNGNHNNNNYSRKRPSNGNNNNNNNRWRPGDWICNGCGFVNFSRRDCCKECNLDKKDSSGGDNNKRVGFYITVVVDMSGSMGENRIKAAMNGLKLIINNMDDDDYISIIGFNDTSNTILEPIKLGKIKNNLPQIYEKIKNETGGQTAMWDALNDSIKMLKKFIKKISNGTSKIERKQRIILLTDGKDTCSNTNSGEIIGNVAFLNQHSTIIDFTLTVIAVGKATEYDDLKKLCQPVYCYLKKVDDYYGIEQAMGNAYRK